MSVRETTLTLYILLSLVGGRGHTPDLQVNKYPSPASSDWLPRAFLIFKLSTSLVGITVYSCNMKGLCSTPALLLPFADLRVCLVGPFLSLLCALRCSSYGTVNCLVLLEPIGRWHGTKTAAGGGSQGMPSPLRASAVPSAMSSMSGYTGNDGDSDEVCIICVELYYRIAHGRGEKPAYSPVSLLSGT